ncbi:unnamed protein product [Nippostrongylus brasiliensis]|uniref:Prefoldin subunit n=1 Tax=Nippostrongylus brasiliensis TaxID=27835 RepID=A0A0N4YAA8_NIPBR|nr:unnamed protein product [Nippostrongylus brasiliensis]
MNDEVMELFRDKDSYKDDMEEVLSANEAIREVLSEENRTEVRETLRTAVLLEISALDQLGFSCNGTKTEEHECTIGLDYLFTATYRLVDVAKEVAEQNQLESIKKAFITFQKASMRKSYKDPALLHDLVNETLEALEQEE